jgi:hypothetical protein
MNKNTAFPDDGGPASGRGFVRTKTKAFRMDLVKYLDNSYTRSFEEQLLAGLSGAGWSPDRISS